MISLFHLCADGKDCQVTHKLTIVKYQEASVEYWHMTNVTLSQLPGLGAVKSVSHNIRLLSVNEVKSRGFIHIEKKLYAHTYTCMCAYTVIQPLFDSCFRCGCSLFLHLCFPGNVLEDHRLMLWNEFKNTHMFIDSNMNKVVDVIREELLTDTFTVLEQVWALTLDSNWTLSDWAWLSELRDTCQYLSTLTLRCLLIVCFTSDKNCKQKV